jgi:hypothetical protein
MWVSAIDNACFKSLVGNFRNIYGIEFADNFGDWQDEDGLVSIEDMAAFQVRKVYEATGLLCIASRTSFEIKPVPPSSSFSSSSSSSSSSNSGSPHMPMSQQPPGRQASSMSSSPSDRIHDIGMNVEYL